MKTSIFIRSVYCFFISSCIIHLFSSCYAIRAYKFRNLELQDHRKLPSAAITASDPVYQYFDNEDSAYTMNRGWLDSNLQNSYTAAFLVIKNDSVLYEKYFDGYNRQSLLPSFSVSKSFVSTLVGIALEEKKIHSLHDPITKYMPELLKSDSNFSRISLQQLLDMRSGIQWNEKDYGLKDDAIKMGFRPNMMKYIKKLKTAVPPAQDSSYKSINTMLLGIAVTRATGMPLATYLQEKLWHPLGMESNATWNTDKKHLPITYGGLNATARDFAKLGSLFLNNGKWRGKQLLGEAWVQASVSEDSIQAYSGYRNQWWGGTEYTYFTDSSNAVHYAATHGNCVVVPYTSRKGIRKYYCREKSSRFYAEGLLGQFIYVCPAKNLVIVRLGHNWNNPKYYLHAFLNEVQKRF